jgi:hypothetical protein
MLVSALSRYCCAIHLKSCSIHRMFLKVADEAAVFASLEACEAPCSDGRVELTEVASTAAQQWAGHCSDTLPAQQQQLAASFLMRNQTFDVDSLAAAIAANAENP